MRCARIALAVLIGLTVPASAHADDTVMIAPGGAIDPARRDMDLYLAPPPAPAIPEGPACAMAKRYVDLVNAGEYAAVAALYADDATFLEPMRPNLHGREQIDAFYTQRIGAMQPQIVAVAYFGDDRECLVELALQIPVDGEMRWVLVSMDHFILNDEGRIASMTAFARPMRGSGEAAHGE